MFIQTEETPNPATLKFLPGRDVMGAGTEEFRSEEEAAGKSLLAERLFDVDGVTGVFFGSDFVTVTKREDKEWYLMKPAVLGVIMEHFTAGRPVVIVSSDAGHASHGEDSEIVSQIKELLDTRVRPAVAMDGGDIVFESFDDGIVTLFMRGACAGCPSSTATLKMGIENMLRHYIPEVREVRAGAL